MFNFLDKDFNEYHKFNSELFSGKNKLSTKPLKTLLWLPSNTLERPQVFLYFENSKEHFALIRTLQDIETRIDLKGTMDLLGGSPMHQINIKNLQGFSSSGKTLADNWFSGYVKFSFSKHVQYKLLSQKSDSKTFSFYISKSDLFTSRVSTMKNFNGELTIHGKGDIALDGLEHLGVSLLTTDGYIGAKENNILKLEFKDASNSYLEFYKNKLPVLEYILAVSSFAERKRLYWFKANVIINTDVIDYYRGDKLYETDQTQPLIERSDFTNYLKTCLAKNLDEIKQVKPFFVAFSNIRKSSIEGSITGMLYLLERYIRYKGDNPDNKQEFLTKNNIYTADLINIIHLKNVRNCIAHGHDIPINDLIIALDHLEIMLERVLLKELDWDFQTSNVSAVYLNHNDTNYKIKVLPSQKKLKCLNNKR